MTVIFVFVFCLFLSTFFGAFSFLFFPLTLVCVLLSMFNAASADGG